MSLPTYSFLPYLRQGIANNLQSTGEARGSFKVNLEVHGEDNGTDKSSPIEEKNVAIYGPGDIIGIDQRQVIKTDPHNWITNFESNYLPYIDFYDEDFPWRYTPVSPNGKRLNPWIALVILQEDEFEEGQNLLDRPLPYFKLKDNATKNFFPKKDQVWAWAHVHFNGDLTPSDSSIEVENPTDVDKGLDKLESILREHPDYGYSRLLCPRKLKPNLAYHAFVIPTYESGRLAGKGASAGDIANAKLLISWEGPDVEFPYYYRWRFNTGSMGDFEYLVRLLKPKVADSRIGRRVMDVTKPDGNLVWTEDPDNALGGILRLGGALKVPDEAMTDEEVAKAEKFDQWASKKFPEFHPFEVQIAGLVNLADDYNINSADSANNKAKTESGVAIDPNDDSDPLITPPIYGKWHAMIERVYKDRDGNSIDENYNWVNELNLDPRFRVAAHFGTRVVQDNQENYMEAAWEQIGDVLTVNKQIRYGQFSMAGSTALFEKNLVAMTAANPINTILFTAPLQKRVMINGTTAFSAVRVSTVPNTILSTTMRRMVRPRGRLLKRLAAFSETKERFRLSTLVEKINDKELLPAPIKEIPVALPSVDGAADQLVPSSIPSWLKQLLINQPWIRFIPLGLALLILILLVIVGPGAVTLSIGIAAAGGLIYLWRKLTQWADAIKTAAALSSEGQKPSSVDELPKSSNFRLADLDENFKASSGGTTDNVNATKFKESLKDMYRLMRVVKSDIPADRNIQPLQPGPFSSAIIEQLNPKKTISAWLKSHILLPPWIIDQLPEDEFTEVMGYPKINRAMYEDLKKISDELFLPNVHLIEQNSLTLLETNQPFIESYMVGLNHEFARELLWREYPTDQRGSYFRQFWDVANILKDPALKDKTEDEKHEPYYDITKLHEWRRTSKLGDHDNRQKPGEPPKAEVVLVIRGELLKKYPTAVVYAHKADWTLDKHNKPDTHEPRSLYQKEEGDKEKPDPDIVKTPLYAAKCDPDIYFFGFDLTVPQARGENEPEVPTFENAGWFFVIKERPGEPRFGFDIPSADEGSLITWNDLDWNKVVPGDGVIDVLNLPAPVVLPGSPVFDTGTDGTGQKEQYDDDINVKWNSSIDAANLAYILYQVPMMVCTHASEMLLKK